MKFYFFLLVCFLVLLGPQTYNNWLKNQYEEQPKDYRKKKFDIDMQVKFSLDNQTIYQNDSKEQSGFITVPDSPLPFTDNLLQKYINKYSKFGKHHSYIWNWEGVDQATISKTGMDKLHHFVNSYLVGFVPFETEQAWVPFYVLSKRKRYEYDHIQYSGLQEVWQNSRQAYLYTRGDCEDHALILADWLIGLGYDARVALGKFKDIGHAWVVVKKDGKEYLLEATSKQRNMNMNGFVLTQLTNNYYPEFQFNRDNFWMNTGSKLTRDYSGDHWKLQSNFHKDI
ncbi:MAG: transglutaminase domain-containing protein [Gammaproteobacteria bacterium]|nr:transglutaminase domain-containing protein [Gammaproteobacteria bacterium]MDH5630149.1 transglutaminase domain-containing protein [Gammaproteobacteria bacterium]